jgi:hypothetical protein
VDVRVKNIVFYENKITFKTEEKFMDIWVIIAVAMCGIVLLMTGITEIVHEAEIEEYYEEF